MAKIAILLYRLLGAVLVWPLAFFVRNHPNFKSTIPQRLGWVLPDIPPGKKTVWIHASSMGEVKAVAGLAHAIRRHKPETFIFLTSMTATGRNVAKGMPDIDLVVPFPFDLHWVMKRYLLRVMPAVILIVETEIWPNLLQAAAGLTVPVVFVNARMTGDSFQKYRKISWLIGPILRHARVLAMAGDDAGRFSSLGAGSVDLLGNLKLDAVGMVDRKKADQLRESLNIGDRPVFLAGSVREGEENLVVDAVIRIKTRVPELLTVIAPRHPDRIATIIRIAEGLGIRWSLRSKGPAEADLLIVDTMGELFSLYGISDAAFVGGSLVDLGGQNILEPIAWGVPTIHGPYMDNFTWALEAVKGLTIQVSNARELGNAVVDIILGKEARDIGRQAREALEKGRGVTERYYSALEEILS
jgi:3-deoxy-D-manno-octulosonic-acid transferase